MLYDLSLMVNSGHNIQGGYMSFPIVPMLPVLLRHYPGLADMHFMAATLGASFFAFGGVFIILLWAGELHGPLMRNQAKSHVREGYFYLGTAVGFALFGAYFMVLMGIYILALILGALFLSLGALRSQ